MSTWRRKAIEAFPELQPELRDGRVVYSIYAFWFELLPLVRTAHREGNEDFLQRAYGYAHRCHGAKSKDLWNSVDVAFYEHLFDERWMWREVLPWLSDDVLRDCWGLWEWRLDPGDLAALRPLVEARIRLPGDGAIARTKPPISPLRT